MQPILTVHLMGGLGNQLFQIATAYAYAKRYSMKLVLPRTWETRSDRKPIWEEYLDPATWTFISPDVYASPHWLVISEKGFAYNPLPDPSTLNHPNGHYKLHGYFQSSLYFNEYANDLRILFKPPQHLLVASIESLVKAGMLTQGSWIGAHVRRGDYLTAAEYHLTCTAEYYKGAREFIERKTSFMPTCWFSEDPEWVKANLFREGDIIVYGNAYVDFTSLSYFKHQILSNSSYSWWFSWLNSYCYPHEERIICCPDKWFGPTVPHDDYTVREAGWFVMDTKSGNLVAQV
jgi:hypothetical protein